MMSLFLILFSYITILLFVINPIHRTAHSLTPSTITISPPSSASDYRQLASLLVSSFDAPQSCKENDKDSISIVERLQWDLFERSLTEEFTYKRYVSTVRRTRGKKYCLLIAKKTDDNGIVVEITDESSSVERSSGVVGMIEMGMSLCPIHNDEESRSNNATEPMSPTPLIGVICVASTMRKEGIAMKLINKCEEVAREIWNEEFVCVDVEPDNVPALSLFEMGGYVECLDGDGGPLLRDTTIVRRRRAEVKPHYLLRKRIRDDDESDESKNDR